MNRRRLPLILAFVLAIALGVFAYLALRPAPPLSSDLLHEGQIVIGHTSDTSNNLMAEIYAATLRAQGLSPALTISSENSAFISALEQGKVDVYPSYLGQISDELNTQANDLDAASLNTNGIQSALDATQQLARPRGFDVLNPTPAANDLVFAVTTEFALANSVRTLSDLSKWSQSHPLRLGSPSACANQTACVTNLESTYGMVIKEVDAYNGAGAATVHALMKGEVDAGAMPKYDSHANDPRLVLLTEDIPLNTMGNYVPLVTQGAMTSQVTNALNEISAKITDTKLAGMLAEIEISDRSPASVASEFVSTSGMGSSAISGFTPVVGVDMETNFPTTVPQLPASAPPIIIGSTEDTQMQIVAELYATYLRANGIKATVKAPSGSEAINAGLKKGDIQLAPVFLSEQAEYLNRAAHGPLALPISSSEPLEVVAKANSLSKYLGYTLLTPSPAQEVNSFTVTNTFAKKHNLANLSDLAKLSRQNPISLAEPPGCDTQNYCGSFLENFYKVKVATIITTDRSGPLTRSAIARNKVDVGWLLSLDPGIPQFGFTILADDQHLQPAFNITPAIRRNVVTPQITALLNEVSASYTTEDLAEMTRQVEFDRVTIKQAVFDFLYYEGPKVNEKTEHVTGGTTSDRSKQISN